VKESEENNVSTLGKGRDLRTGDNDRGEKDKSDKSFNLISNNLRACSKIGFGVEGAEGGGRNGPPHELDHHLNPSLKISLPE
jgi:hypothetical protein